MREDFWDLLSGWYTKNKRDLPWRQTREPYAIWLSEVILQQTRINQGLEYYLRFLETYPDVFSLAKASENDVYRLWQGLGYYNRANNLMKTAKLIAERYQGEFPPDIQLLKSLPGIGDYTAAAIASISFDLPTPVVDGNVYRVLSRIYGIKTPIDTSRGKKEFTEKATALMHHHPPAEFNQAMMEFGALHCLPANPDCKNCIFKTRCVAFSKAKQLDFPVKKAKTKVRNRYIYYFVIQTNSTEPGFFLKKREARDIWRNLYDFPSVESATAFPNPKEALQQAERKGLFSFQKYKTGTISRKYQHRLTHLKIFATFIPIILSEEPKKEPENLLLLISKSNLNNYPLPQIIVCYLKDNKIIH